MRELDDLFECRAEISPDARRVVVHRCGIGGIDNLLYLFLVV